MSPPSISNTVGATCPAALPAAAAPHTTPRAAAAVLRVLARITYGSVHLVLPDGRERILGRAGAQPAARLEIRAWSVFNAVLRSGDIGLAEAFIAGHWHTDALPQLLELLIHNRAALEETVYGSWWGRLAYRLKHLLNRNSRAGSRKNIHAHYDIGNAFYRLWLDPSMTYSSALFNDTSGADLQRAQAEKYRAILGQLRLAPGQRVLEIGCGWGGFAEVAVREAGVHVTGLTLSTEQLAWAEARMRRAGLDGSADLKLCDYRDNDGVYDAVASIEMFEAVGESYWPSYFDCVARSLKPGGRACIQTIVIADGLFERYRTSTDFIQQFIFPGGMLPSPSVFRRLADQHGLRVVREHAFGQDYAATLAAWRVAFHANLDAVRAQGFDQQFIQTWEFYLCYCEAAFRAGSTDVMHFTLEKPC